MSVRTLTTLAVQRDAAAPGDPAMGGAAGAGEGSIPQQFVDALTSAIPTEPLAGYTAIVAVVAGLGSGSNYLPFRWGAFGIFLLVTAASIYVSYEFKAARFNKRTFPDIELAAGLIAATSWGLAMPGSPLNAALKGNTSTLAAASIAIGGAAALSLLSPWMTQASNTPGQAAVAGSQAAGYAVVDLTAGGPLAGGASGVAGGASGVAGPPPPAPPAAQPPPAPAAPAGPGPGATVMAEPAGQAAVTPAGGVAAGPAPAGQ